jgi:hypothetical protein
LISFKRDFATQESHVGPECCVVIVGVVHTREGKRGTGGTWLANTGIGIVSEFRGNDGFGGGRIDGLFISFILEGMR